MHASVETYNHAFIFRDGEKVSLCEKNSHPHTVGNKENTSPSAIVLCVCRVGEDDFSEELPAPTFHTPFRTKSVLKKKRN